MSPAQTWFHCPSQLRRQRSTGTRRGNTAECDLDTPEEIFELVTRQYSDIVQDDLLATYFAFGADAMDWRAHILRVADYWNHVLLFAPSYEIDIIGRHQAIHEDGEPFSADAFDRWLQIFLDAVDGGWTGPNAEIAKKRATGMAWAMAQRVLGKGGLAAVPAMTCVPWFHLCIPKTHQGRFPMETLVEAMERLRSIGYVNDFSATSGGHLRCEVCRSNHDPAAISIIETVRFEGDSNPDDESILLALECECGALGQYTAAFGPDTPAEDALVLHSLIRPPA